MKMSQFELYKLCLWGGFTHLEAMGLLTTLPSSVDFNRTNQRGRCAKSGWTSYTRRCYADLNNFVDIVSRKIESIEMYRIYLEYHEGVSIPT